MKELMVADLAGRENQNVTGYFAAGAKSVRTKKDGTRYFALTLADRTGPIEARVWDASDAGDFEDLPGGFGSERSGSGLHAGASGGDGGIF